MDKKLCPLTLKNENGVYKSVQCQEESCAWWCRMSESVGECAIKKLATKSFSVAR
jgi:hypothetical protein